MGERGQGTGFYTFRLGGGGSGEDMKASRQKSQRVDTAITVGNPLESWGVG